MLEIQGDIGVYLSGGQVVVKDCNIILEQPKIKDVLLFGENTFFSMLEMLSDIEKFFSQLKEEHSEFQEIASFQMFLELLQQPQAQSLREDLTIFFGLVCPQYKIEFAKNGIKFLVYDEEQKKDVARGMLNQITQESFGTTVKELFSAESAIVANNLDYNIDKNNPKAVALEKKLKEARAKVAKNKRQVGSSNKSILGDMCSVLSIGLSQPITCFLELTPFQLYNMFHRYILKRQYDMYEQGVLLNPWASKDDIDEDSVPKDWTGNIYSFKED